MKVENVGWSNENTLDEVEFFVSQGKNLLYHFDSYFLYLNWLNSY